jgi:holo-[acyl-carrier protein] synthase
MILGIGTDIIEISRIKANIERYQERFLDRIFTESEQTYCLSRKEPSLHFAGRFAAKEAVSKALGTGFSEGLNWLDIEVYLDEKGKPHIRPSPNLNSLFSSPVFDISISHCHTYAIAFAIWMDQSSTNKISPNSGC